MTITYRIALLALTVVVGTTILLDPYTFSASTSHFRIPAPAWQTAVAIADLWLLGLFGAAVWKSQRKRAILLQALGTMLNVLTNIIFVLRDGVDRFLMAFGTYEILSLYLGILAIRFGMLAVLALLSEANIPQRDVPEL